MEPLKSNPYASPLPVEESGNNDLTAFVRRVRESFYSIGLFATYVASATVVVAVVDITEKRMPQLSEEGLYFVLGGIPVCITAITCMIRTRIAQKKIGGKSVVQLLQEAGIHTPQGELSYMQALRLLNSAEQALKNES